VWARFEKIRLNHVNLYNKFKICFQNKSLEFIFGNINENTETESFFKIAIIDKVPTNIVFSMYTGT
jgi:hypothetical protein